MAPSIMPPSRACRSRSRSDPTLGSDPIPEWGPSDCATKTRVLSQCGTVVNQLFNGGNGGSTSNAKRALKQCETGPKPPHERGAELGVVCSTFNKSISFRVHVGVAQKMSDG